MYCFFREPLRPPGGLAVVELTLACSVELFGLGCSYFGGDGVLKASNGCGWSEFAAPSALSLLDSKADSGDVVSPEQSDSSLRFSGVEKVEFGVEEADAAKELFASGRNGFTIDTDGAGLCMPSMAKRFTLLTLEPRAEARRLAWLRLV